MSLNFSVIRFNLGTVRIDLLDEEEEDQFVVTPDIVDVESLSEVERYQWFTFPEEACYDLKIDKISMKKTPRDSCAEGRRFDLSDEACELGPQIYTLKITTANEKWRDVDNVQATIVFSGHAMDNLEELSDYEFAPDGPQDLPEDVEEDSDAREDDIQETEMGSEGNPVSEADSATEEYTEWIEEDVAEDEVVSDDFVLEATDEFLLHNLKNIGKVECVFVTMASDEIWQFHEIRVTRVKREEKAVLSTEEVHFKPVSKLYRRTSRMFSPYLNI